MTVFVPPAVFGEVETVFDSPVVSNVAEYFVSGNLIGIQARNKITSIAEDDAAVVRC